MHHIVSDGWSMGVLHRELSELYRAFTQGKSSPLSELPIQYSDYAIWQREWLTGKELERQLSYWKKQLEGAPALLNVPTDRVRPAVQSFRGASQSITLSKEVSEQLKGLSRKQGVTLFMTLLAAFQTLLYRYTGQEDIVVGSPIANRTRSEIEGLIGFFVNTLVLRGRFGGNPTFRELLAETRRVALDAYEHQDLPFEKLVEELKPERSLSYSPVFQVMFVLQNAPEGALSFEGVSVSRVRTGSETAKFDLTLSVHETAQGLTGSLQYNTDLFERATITRLLKHFETLLRGIVDDASQRISDLPILTEADRRELLEWSETKQDYPKDKCIHELFVDQAKRTPEAIAVVLEGQQITYRELNERANRLACRLQRSGVGPNILVGLCAERSIELIVGILGILKAGGAYVPLDPHYPAARLEFMLKDSHVSVVVSQKHLAANFPADETTVVYLDTEPLESSSAEGVAASDLESETQPDNLAYVIYTSGSTGNPKGVWVTHYNVVRLFQSTQAWFDFNASDVWTLFHSYAFDFSVWEMWGALLHGGKLIVVPHAVSRSPEEFAEVIKQNGVTVLNQTPSSFRQLMGRLISTLSPEQSCLRYVIFGGEALELQSLQPWFDRYGDGTTQLMNMYGITETTVHVTYRPITRADIESRATSVIGRPIPDLRVYILDPQRNLQPVGIPGEIYVGGAGVATGYLQRPQLMSERFVHDPFSNDAQARLYRSGDLARWLPNGELEYLGRIDDQIKIRGFRIEPGEIEAALTQHAQVKDAIVIAREDTPGDKRLVAYTVMDDKVTVEELRRSLCGILPDYMVPSILVRLRSFPLTSNGKIDRRALPMPDVHRPDLAETYVAPRNAIEELVARVWGEVLKLERVGIHDNFFALGGHSLLATRVISRINDSFRTAIPLRRLFETPTISELAAAIDLTRATESNREIIPPIVPVTRDDKIPLSFSQQRLWFLDRLTPQSAAYNVPAAFRLAGELKLHVLEQSLNEIVRRHEVLRTVFETVSGEPNQKISLLANCPLTYIDLSDRPEKEREACLREIVAEEAETPFDLSCGPLIRAKVLRIASQDHALLLNMHHIVSDGWSMGLLFHELSAHYEAFCLGNPSPLPELPIQYADYSVWQQNWLQNEKEVGKHLSYWREQLDGVSTLQLPIDYPRPTIQTYQGTSRSLDLSNKLTQALKDLSQQEGVTLYMTLLAAFQILLFRYSGQSDIAVGSPIAGRTRQETERLIGFFVNTLVLRTEFSNDPIFTELLQRVRGTTLEAYSRQDLPFEKLVEELHPDRNLSNSPLFQVMFILQNNVEAVLNLKELTVTPIRVTTRSAKFDLTLTMSEKSGKLAGSINYSTDLFDAATIERMASHFKILLQGIVADRNRRVSNLPILTDLEKHQLLVEFNNTEAEFPKDKCIHQLFEEQVEKTPDEIALVCEERQFTYRELNTRANQLAHYLQRLGVDPESRVGVCMERSLNLIVGLLGVLKAGGAYVPLDPTYPRDRLLFMLRDSEASVVITQNSLQDQVPGYDRPKIVLDGADARIIDQQPTTNIARSEHSSGLGYVIYTSGSTGQPKGVLGLHSGAVNRFAWMWNVLPFEAGEICCQKTSISFVDSIWEIFGPLLKGVPIVIIADDVATDAKLLVEAVRRYRVTRLVVVPSLLRAIFESCRDLAEKWSELKICISSGEALPKDLVSSFATKLPSARLLNLYGSSEVSADVSFWEMDRKLAPPDFVPIGRPISNTKFYVLDARNHLVPVGIWGELHVGGAGLARGYLNRTELTSERFVGDSLSGAEGTFLFKTGDLVRYRPDGNLEFLGRIDQQVKVRGFRIEPGEVGEVLNRHPEVRECVVTAVIDNHAETRLVAYVVTRTEAQIPPEELRRFLSEKLPQYMIPSSFVFLSSLPLTPNGKLNRKALPAPDWLGRTLGRTFVAPRTSAEQRLAKIWAEILNVEQIGIDDNFFDIGGHSLLAAKLFARLDEDFGISLPLSVLFSSPTLRTLAEHCSQSFEKQDYLALVPLVTEGELPAIFAMPGVFGNVLGFAPLSRELGRKYPFYALQSIGLDGRHSPLETIDEMAEQYINEVTSVQSQGPYILIGACFGATVAFEIARQLLLRGKEVAYLGLIDPTNQEFPVLNSNRSVRFGGGHKTAALRSLLLNRIRLYAEELRKIPGAKRPHYLFRKIFAVGATLTSVNKTKRLTREFHQLQVTGANRRALRRYRPKHLFGRLAVVEIFESDHPRNAPDRKFSFENFWSGKVTYHHISAKDSGDILSRDNSIKVGRIMISSLASVLRDSATEEHLKPDRIAPSSIKRINRNR